MRQFVMSMYANKEDLYKAKSEYYQDLCGQLLHQLKMSEDVSTDIYDEWYWTATGERVGDDIE